MNTFECEIYMFGSPRTVFINTEHTLEEIKSDWGLREQLIAEKIVDMYDVQNHIKQL